MRNADGEGPWKTRLWALPALRMNELDKLKLDEESPKGSPVSRCRHSWSRLRLRSHRWGNAAPRAEDPDS